jgi:predicted nuclease of predicted toxin-antitoxin system
LKLLVDAQLPPILAEWLRDRGLAATHLGELGLLAASDGEIWDLAVREGYVLVTKDRDFVEWSRHRTPRARVLWVRFGNMRRDVLLARMEGALDDLRQALEGDAAVVEIGR